VAILTGNDNGIESSILRIPGLEGRNDLPTLEGRNHVSLALYRHDRPAPLLFILPGFGASPFFGVSPYLAELFYREGFHIVILPSPMSWNFALAASRSGAPGYAPEDARDLYNVMQKTLAMLRTRHGLSPTEINFLGFSLGGLEGAYLSVIDAEEQKVGISRYLLINPPLNLAYAIDKIAEWNALGRKFGPEKSRGLIAQALAIADSFSFKFGSDLEVMERFVRSFDVFTTAEIQFLIAENLQYQLPELVYVTQVIRDQKVLTTPQSDMRGRLNEARAFTLRDYERKIALPLWRKLFGGSTTELEAFIEQGSLARILGRLRANPKVRVMHNADDVLAERQSIEALSESLGHRMMVYPHGGHLGNLWFPPLQLDALKFFRSPLTSTPSK
jgi:pimeloyl-ACP methyl ester carboxylesterase